MKCKKEIKQGAISFDIENSVGSLLGFRKVLHKTSDYSSQKIVDIMALNTVNNHCKIISDVRDNGNDTDILYTFNIIYPPGYMINILPNNVLFQNVTKDRIEKIEFNIKDEFGRPIDLIGDVLSFTLYLVLIPKFGLIQNIVIV